MVPKTVTCRSHPFYLLKYRGLINRQKIVCTSENPQAGAIGGHILILRLNKINLCSPNRDVNSCVGIAIRFTQRGELN